jgi:DNA-binding FrmR family transcriptional regulator
MTDYDKKILIALKKAKSHLDNVIRMVEGGEYCINILQQNLAVLGLLKSANNRLLERHLNTCFATAMRKADEKKKQKMIEEILRIERLSK